MALTGAGAAAAAAFLDILMIFPRNGRYNRPKVARAGCNGLLAQSRKCTKLEA